MNAAVDARGCSVADGRRAPKSHSAQSERNREESQGIVHERLIEREGVDGPELLSRSCCCSPSSSLDRSIVSTPVSSSPAESNLLPLLQLWTSPPSPTAAPSTSLAAHLCRRETSSTSSSRSSSTDESDLLSVPSNVETVVQPDEEVEAAEGWESNARSEAAALRVDEEADVERTMGPSSTWSAIIERVKQRRRWMREEKEEKGSLGRREGVLWLPGLELRSE